VTDARCRWCCGEDVEFGWYPAVLARLPDLDETTRVAAGCRGTGDRPVLRQVGDGMARLRPRTGTVLDVGAGTGGPARWLGDHYGWRTVAAEPSGASLATARAFFPGLPLLRCEASRLPVPDRAVDAALLIGVLSLVDEVAASLREARRVVRDGGLLAVSDYLAPDSRSVRRAVLPAGTRAHVTADLLGAARAAGWAVQDVTVGGVSADEEWAAARDAVDDLVARHVERTPHGREAACPAAFDAERAARGVLGDAIDGGTLVRVTLVAEAVGAPGGRARRDAGARRAPGPGPSGGPPSR
jgi:SAM-dependent methyltransferase